MSNPDDSPVRIFAIKPDNKEVLLRLALLAYVGQVCTECEHTFDSVDDIIARSPRVSGKDPIRLACNACYKPKV